MLDVYFVENGCIVVGDDDVVEVVNEYFVYFFWIEGGFNCFGYNFGSKNVEFLGVFFNVFLGFFR